MKFNPVVEKIFVEAIATLRSPKEAELIVFQKLEDLCEPQPERSYDVRTLVRYARWCQNKGYLHRDIGEINDQRFVKMIQKETLAILDKQNMDDRDLDFLFNAYHLLARSDYISSKICLLGACTAEALDNRTVIGSQSFRHNRSLQMDGRIIVNPDTLSLEVDRNKNVNLQDENSLMGTVGGFDFDILNKINSIIKQPADTMDYQASVKLYSDIVARFKEEHPKESDIQVFDKWLRQNDPITFIRVNVITHFLPEECKLRIGGFTKREPDYFVSYSDVTKVTDIEFPVPRQMKEAGSR